MVCQNERLTPSQSFWAVVLVGVLDAEVVV